MLLTQSRRWLRVASALGENKILAEELSGREGISQLFDFHVRGLTDAAVAPADLLGTDLTLSVARFSEATRHISGVVTGLSLGHGMRDGHREIELTLEPSIAALRHSRDYRIFQNKTVEEIATAVLSRRSIDNVRFSISGAKSPRAYCVQFGETDLRFVSRLFQEEGWFYFFEHTESGHTLVVCDAATSYPASPAALLEYTPGTDEGFGIGLVQNLRVRSARVDMKSAWRQFDFTAPASPIDGTTSTTLSGLSDGGWEQFHYGQGAAVAQTQTGLSKAGIDASDSGAEIITGTSSEPRLTPGYTLALAAPPYKDVTLADGASLDQASVVPIRVSHTARDPSYFARRPTLERKPFYRVEFEAIPAARAARPAYPLPKPLAHGPQTATVVGPSGDEIHTDAHGRIRVQFHWDRVGEKNENSSCFVRVAQGWAGNGWGLQFIPRIGMEVVVHFLDGDPDQPLVTGVLYNGANVPPFALPGQMNKSGLRTRSTKSGSTETFNELSFDDTKDKEMVLFHAQKDFTRKVENDDVLDVGHDQTRTVKNNRTTTIAEGNETFTIDKGNRTEKIAQGNETLTIAQGNRAVDITQGNDELKLGSGNLSITLQTGNMTTKLQAGNMASELQAGNLTQKCTAGSVTIEALQGITLKCGSSTVEITPQGVTIKGLMVTAQASAKAELSGAMVDVKGSGMTQINGGLVKIN